MVNAALVDEFKEGGLHALSLVAKAPDEVQVATSE